MITDHRKFLYEISASDQAIFDQLVVQTRDAGLIQDKLRITDATHLYSAVAIHTT